MKAGCVRILARLLSERTAGAIGGRMADECDLVVLMVDPAGSGLFGGSVAVVDLFRHGVAGPDDAGDRNWDPIGQE